MGYTPGQVHQAIKRQEQMAGRECRLLKEGEVEYRVDPVLFHNARIQNQKDYGVHNIWDEPEWVRDQIARHPGLLKPRSFGKIRVGATCGSPVRAAGGGRLTRFGRVTFHKSYGKAG